MPAAHRAWIAPAEEICEGKRRHTHFAWTDIPSTQYGRQTGRFGGESQLGLLRVVTDEGIEGNAFLGSAIRSAEFDAASLIHLCLRKT